ncbi:hypothetical protein ACTS9T_10000 [Empedobacter falsenii]
MKYRFIIFITSVLLLINCKENNLDYYGQYKIDSKSHSEKYSNTIIFLADENYCEIINNGNKTSGIWYYEIIENRKENIVIKINNKTSYGILEKNIITFIRPNSLTDYNFSMVKFVKLSKE